MQMTTLSGAHRGDRVLQAGTLPDPRLAPGAAREFEAQMMKELLAPMNHRSALFEDGGSERKRSDRRVCIGVPGWYTQRPRRFGVANRIVQSISRFGRPPERLRYPENSHINNEMSPHKSLERISEEDRR